MQTVICRQCGIIRTNPRLDDASWKAFYTHEYPHIHAHPAFAFSQDTARYYPFLHQREYHRAHHIDRFIAEALKNEPPPGRPHPVLLDIGTGTGGMMTFYAQKNWQVHGCDYDEGAVAHARERRLDITLGGPMTRLHQQPPADLVLLSHVLEHVTDAHAYLDTIASLIRPGGYLYIELPGVLQISAKRYANDFLRYLRIFHTFSFSKCTLQNLLESHGFTLVTGNEFIKTLFRYTGQATKVMQPRPNDYSVIKDHILRAEHRRLLTAPYAKIYESLRQHRSHLAQPIIALGLKKPVKRLLQRLGYQDLE